MTAKVRTFIKKTLIAISALLLLAALIISGIIIYYLLAAQAYERLAQRAVLKPVKVFQIGFSKCGTVSLASFFNQNGIPAVHHDFGMLASSMFENARRGLPLIAPQYEQYAVFTDMENMFAEQQINIPVHFFKELDRQYPGSKFILNIRDKAAWLRSRAAHAVYKKTITNQLTDTANMLHISEQDVLAMWSQQWDTHQQAVLEYFKNRPNDLLVFNIDVDGPQKLVAFFKDYYKLNFKYYGHKNKSPKKAKTTVEDPVKSKQLFTKSFPITTTQLGAYNAS